MSECKKKKKKGIPHDHEMSVKRKMQKNMSSKKPEQHSPKLM
jgi:hypothetical protein